MEYKREDIEECYEKLYNTPGYVNHPYWHVITVLFYSYSEHVVSFLILYEVFWPLCVLYVCVQIWVEFATITEVCVNCFYYGKLCPRGGKGFIARLFLLNKKKRSNHVLRHCSRKFGWKNMARFMVPITVCTLIGIVKLFFAFKWMLLLKVVYLVVHQVVLTPVLHTHLLCKNCKNREMCPGKRFF